MQFFEERDHSKLCDFDWAWAFEGCSSLKSVTIPNSVTLIGTSAFEVGSSLESVTIQTLSRKFGSRLFRDAVL